MTKEEYPHVRAAFINAIREEGTKEQACDWLQKQWNETCYLRGQLKEANRMLDNAAQALYVKNSDGT